MSYEGINVCAATTVALYRLQIASVVTSQEATLSSECMQRFCVTDVECVIEAAF